MLETEHSDHIRKTEDLADKLDVDVDHLNKDIVAIGAEGAASVAKLTLKSGAEFERAYLDAMIKDHSDAIKLIDEKLVKDASEAELKAHLSATRASVVKHLEHARHLRD
jgi:putative membrane protein